MAIGRATSRKPRTKPAAKPKAAQPRSVAKSPLPATANLLAQILEAPDDLDLRRVYADRCTESGDPHGEFIQLSCDAEPFDRDDPRRAKLERAALALRRRHGLEFSRSLRSVAFFNRCAESAPPYGFGRGFPELACGTASDVVAALRDGARAAPLRGLRLTHATDADVRQLAMLPELGRIRDLEIAGDGDLAPALAELFASHHLARLDRVSLRTRIAPGVLQTLAAAPALEGLGALELANVQRDVPLDAEPLSRLLRSPRLARLRRLAVSDLLVPVEAIAALAELEDLALENVELGARGAAALVAGPGLRGLRALDLRRCELADKGVIAIASARLPDLTRLTLGAAINGKRAAPLFEALATSSLRELGLIGGALRAEGIKALVAASGTLKRLRRLDLTSSMLKDAGAIELARLALPSLEALVLDYNGIGADGMAALGASDAIAGLSELSLGHNKCGSEGGQNLAAGGRLAKLRSLALVYNWMGVKGVRALLAAAPGLERLHAGENNYGDAPARFIAELGAASRLRIVELRDCTPETASTLFASPAAHRFEELQLESCRLEHDVIDPLCGLPTLESLRCFFVSANDADARQLHARFGPNLSIWGGYEDWRDLPGPPV